MKIALVHHHLHQIGGSEKVLFNFSEIYPDAPIFTSIYNKKNFGDFFEGKIIKTSFLQNFSLGIKKFKWFLPLMPTLFENFDFSGYDVIISNDSSFAKGVITPQRSLHICYCHTPTRFLWVDVHKYIKELPQPNIIKKVLPFFLNYLRIWDWQAAQRPDKLIANSHFIAKRIKKYYSRESEVIYPPVETDQFKISQNIDKYFLIISRFMPYKRVDLAIKAFNKLKIPLKIIGSGEDEERLKNLAERNIEFLGSVSDKKKAEYLSHCKALIHPQEEDFGIVSIEAMASGRPVIAFKAGGALETVIEDFNGKFFDEQTWEALADTVVHFQSEKFDSFKIKKYAQKFSKERFKKEIKEFVEREYKKFLTSVIYNPRKTREFVLR